MHDIVNHMREYPDDDIWSSDNPRTREVGWRSSSGKTWGITLTNIQREISEDEKIRRAASFFTSTRGRQDIVTFLREIANSSEVNSNHFTDFVGNPPVPPPPPPPRTRFQIIDDD